MPPFYGDDDRGRYSPRRGCSILLSAVALAPGLGPPGALSFYVPCPIGSAFALRRGIQRLHSRVRLSIAYDRARKVSLALPRSLMTMVLSTC